MGTGAVYVVLGGLKDKSPIVPTIETVFYFLNMALFLLNTATLLLQAIRSFMYISYCRLPRLLTQLFSLSSSGIPTSDGSCQRHFRSLDRKPAQFSVAPQLLSPSQVLSFATIVIGTISYAVPRHVGPNVIYALFWCVIYGELLLNRTHSEQCTGSMLLLLS